LREQTDGTTIHSPKFWIVTQKRQQQLNVWKGTSFIKYLKCQWFNTEEFVISIILNPISQRG
jgi:hypothetical protein